MGAGNAIRSRCGADLADADEVVQATGVMLDVQRMMLRVVASGYGSVGIYADSRPRTIQVLSDMALLSQIGRQALADGEHIGWFDMDGIDREAIGTNPRTRKVGLRPSEAREVALGNTLAFSALQDEARLSELFRGRVGAHIALDHYSPPVRVQLSLALGRTSRPTTLLQSQSTMSVAPEARAAKLPAVLWPQWTGVLAPRRLDSEIAGGALSAAIVFTGTRLTHGAAIRLFDPKVNGRQVSHVMRSLGHNAPEADTIRALVRLAAYLDEHETPVDFARRRSLDYSRILSDEEWREICRDAGVVPGGARRWLLARAHLYATLSGNRLAAAPFSNEKAFPSVGELTRFRDGIPADIADALEACGESFLQAQGVDEPVSWMPALEVADLHPESGDTKLSPWAEARPARAAVERSRAALAYAAGQSLTEIGTDHGVARQTVGRVLDDAGVPTRRGRRSARIDPDWLRHRYEVERRTIPEIAAELGITGTTVSRHLVNAGIERRARGSASRATAIRVDPRAGESALLSRILVGQDSVQRAERFLVVARHDTMTTAAKELGAALSLLTAQMKRLGADAGGPLITRAFRGRPLALTNLGQEVRAELIRALGVDVTDISEDAGPAPRQEEFR